MKRNKFIIVALTVLLLVVALVACDTNGKTQQPKNTYILSKSSSLPYTLTVGDDVDFTQYFSIVKVSGVGGNNDIGEIVPVTTDMLDLTDVDLTKAGTFDVTLSYGGKTLTATFTVVAGGAGNIDFDALCANYDSYDKWNFGVKFAVEIGGNEGWEYQYGFLKDDVSMTYLYYGQELTDYIAYDTQNDTYHYYYDNGDGTYSLYGEDDDDFMSLYMYVDYLELVNLSSLEFTERTVDWSPTIRKRRERKSSADTRIPFGRRWKYSFKTTVLHKSRRLQTILTRTVRASNMLTISTLTITAEFQSTSKH